MEITDVKVRLVEGKTERLRGFCTVTVDREFVVRDIKIIDGTKGLFVAMPSRKLTDHCPKCGSKNHLRAKFCNECGARLPGKRTPEAAEGGGSKLHVDVAHPINTECRARFQKAVLAAYHAEVEKSTTPGYVPPDLDVFDEEGRHPRPGTAPSPGPRSPSAGVASEGKEKPEEEKKPPPDSGESFNAGLR